MSEQTYLTTQCPHCDGGIEFPLHGLDEWIDCPHCANKVRLGSIPEKAEIPPCSPPKPNKRKSFPVLGQEIVRGTLMAFAILFSIGIISEGVNKYQSYQQKLKSEAEAKIKEKEASDLYAAQANRAVQIMNERQEKLKAYYAEQATELANETKERQRKLEVFETQQKIDALTDEIRRGNEIADRAEKAAFLDSLERRYPTKSDITKIAKSDKEWILRYNPYKDQWQYAPADAVLKYNGYENRWEFVPKQ